MSSTVEALSMLRLESFLFRMAIAPCAVAASCRALEINRWPAAPGVSTDCCLIRRTQHRQVSESTTPPSTRNGEPVIALASREQRKATASAISSGLVSRLMIEVGRPVSMNAR